MEGNMTLKPIVHEIRIQNQVIFLDPPIEYARSTWIKQLHDWLGNEKFWTLFTWMPQLMFILGVVCRLHRIQSSRYEIGLQMQGASAAETTYSSLVYSMSFDLKKLLSNPFFKCLVDSLPRKYQPRKTFCFNWDKGPTSQGLCWQMATIPISMGSRSRIRV